jgi:glycosyltransferase involved in cell wall biosynthesis
MMLNTKVIVTVIPAYNVEEQIISTIKGIHSFVDYIIVVDDCSSDKTNEIVSKIDDERVILLKNDKNQGVGGATVAGLIKGLELGGDIFIKLDGDNQMDPDKMEDLIEPLFNGFDYAKGNRFLHTNELGDMPTIRLAGNFVLTFLTKLSSGYWKIFDPQNGYVAISRGALDKLPLTNLYRRYFFENDMLVNLNINGSRVKDVSIPARYGNEKSSLKIRKVLFTFPRLLISRFLKRIYKKYILYDFSIIGFFYVIGLILMALGTMFGSYHWIKSVYTGNIATTGTVMIAVLPIILGFQLFLQAIVLEVEQESI